GGGAIAADSAIADKVKATLHEAGIDAEIELIEGGDCAVRARAVAERGDPLLIVGGGDGTVAAAASALVGTETRLGILPLGTLNHFARDLGIPADLGEAAKLIAVGAERRVDVGEMNERIFINNSAIGLYPLMVVSRDVQQKRFGRSKRLAMLVASLRTLARFGHQRLTLTVNEKQALVETPLLFVGNNDYRLDLGAPGQRERLDDGKLCVLVMRKKTRRGFLAATVRALLNRTRHDDMVRLDGVERLRVDSRRSHLAVSLDGEVIRAAPPLDYRIRKLALRVIAPEP
ncbi:MAG TPA: diacylglycerol kinase family protein, partial [Sphingomicrobium sp.]